MAIRFFNTYEPVITIYRDLLPALAQNGYVVEVFVSKSIYRESEVSLEQMAQAHPGISIRRLYSPFKAVDGRLSKVTNIIFYILLMMAYSLFGKKSDINVFLTQPPFSSLWGYVLKRIKGQSYACLLMDIYPDVMIKDGVLKEGGYIAKLMKNAVEYSWRKANAIFVIGRCMCERVREAGVDPDNIHVITNWHDESKIYPVAKADNRLLQELGLADKFIVLYSGNLGVSHQFDDILDAAEKLKDIEDLTFVFVGSGSRRQQVQSAINSGLLKNIVLLPYQPFDRLAESLSMADVHYVCLRDEFEGLVVPSKTYPALASGRPMVYSGSEKGEIARMLNENACGVVVQQNDSDSLAKAITAYYKDPALRQAAGGNSVNAVRGDYSRTICVQRYLKVFDKLAGR